MTGQNKSSGYPDRDPQLMYELAKEGLASQLESVNALDGKIAMLVSLASALLGITAAVYALRAATKSGSVPALTSGEVATLVVGGVAYLVVAAKGLWAYFVHTWSGAPDLDAIWEKQKGDLSNARLKWEVANDFMYSADDNQSALDSKVRALRIIFAGTVVESIVLVISLFLVAGV
jgi:hypothetical protein